MENRYPLFAGGRILKKESLWDLRDYTYQSLQLCYMDYTNGVLKGCRVRVEGGELVIGKGMLKFRDFIYLLQEERRIPFTAQNKMMSLKAVFEMRKDNLDYIAYRVLFLLDSNLNLQENQMELCRFHLRIGSVLRDSYKDFRDMRTEYDTINLLHATIAGRECGRLHPKVLLQFAKSMQEHDRKSLEDIVFCYQILQNAGEIEQGVVEAYLDNDLNTDCFDMLENRLNCLGYRKEDIEKNRVIYVE